MREFNLNYLSGTPCHLSTHIKTGFVASFIETKFRTYDLLSYIHSLS
ncbi:hypothetical protein VCRA2133E348_340044 [Vibrio crassostreae]|nr:hypothetical protein VCRA2133E348_340044 [Vibrio crassostreae]